MSDKMKTKQTDKQASKLTNKQKHTYSKLTGSKWEKKLNNINLDDLMQS